MKKIAIGILLISAVIFVLIVDGEVQDVETPVEPKEVTK